MTQSQTISHAYIVNAYTVLISRRFLRARSFNVQKAYEQFERSSNWRQTYKVDSTYDSFPITEFESSKQFYPRWNGRRDHLGRPIERTHVGPRREEVSTNHLID
jgi:hypothetical protein